MAETAPDPVALAVPAPDPGPIKGLERVASRRMAGLAEAALGRFVRQGARGGTATSHIEQSLEAAFLLKGEPGSEAIATYLHPAFCHWMKGAYRLAEDDPTTRANWIAHIADFLWPLAAREGGPAIAWQTRLDDRGGLRCVAGRRYFEFGADRAGRAITIESDTGDAYVRIRFGDGLLVHIPHEDIRAPAGRAEPSLDVHGYEIHRLPAIADGRIEFGHRDPSLRVHFTGTNQRTTGIDFFAISSGVMDDWPDPARFDRLTHDLARLWPAAHGEMCHLVRALVPVRSPGDTRLGFTVSSRQGAVFLEDTDDRSLLHNLVHEAAHIKLRHLQLIDMMMEDWADETLVFKVPWREDKRPLAGIFEGVFVFSHVRELEMHMVAQGFAKDCGEVEKLEADIAQGLAILSEHAPLTETGRAFFAALRDWTGVSLAAAV